MIKIIVNLYRGVIGFIFVIGVLIGFAYFATYSSGTGLFGGVAVILTTVLVTGISAVLISINDHLAAMRNRD